MLHKTPLERYEKLKKVLGRLLRQFNRDDLDDFVQTANSLREWIQKDETLLPEQKAALERFVVDKSVDWQICNQLANHQKHRGASPRSKKRRRSTSESIPRVTAVGISAGAQGVLVSPSMQIVARGKKSGSNARVGVNLRSHLRFGRSGIFITSSKSLQSLLASEWSGMLAGT